MENKAFIIYWSVVGECKIFVNIYIYEGIFVSIKAQIGEAVQTNQKRKYIVFKDFNYFS